VALSHEAGGRAHLGCEHLGLVTLVEFADEQFVHLGEQLWVIDRLQHGRDHAWHLRGWLTLHHLRHELHLLLLRFDGIKCVQRQVPLLLGVDSLAQ
jgi:hypothetical protein